MNNNKLAHELGDWTVEELQAEVDRRKEEERRHAMPELLAEPDITLLQELCRNYISEIHNGRTDLDDWHEWFYEGVLNVFYGKEVWTWLGQQEEQ